ncbi:MAG: PIN domain-containing protein [Treponema sp.]|jgi:predicted nucleic acid-binding protein|nr:PIN domain-containing protein [Treponema sp.]
MKILVDANIALDVLLERQPFYVSGVKILSLSKGGIELFLSASTVTDIYYIIRKELKNKETALTLLKNLLVNVDVAAVTNNEIYRAIDLNWDDLEDAVQYAAGETIAVDYLVTRNTSDFSATDYPVVTPDELLSILTSYE